MGSTEIIAAKTNASTSTKPKTRRVQSIDLLRGTVMIIMALDHVRDYFHAYSYAYDPTDLQHTSIAIFFTRWITHFCAPIFMLLAGVSACLYGYKNGRSSLSFFLFTRGLWLVIAELFIVTLEWTFNPHYPTFILQVIWAFGISMMVLSLLIHLPRPALLLIGIVLVAGHNALDNVHVAGNGMAAFGWALLHEQNFGFHFGAIDPLVGYPVLPWIGIITLGYCLGSLYAQDVDPEVRKRSLRNLGIGAILLFIILRWSNIYGDHAHWSTQRNFAYTILSFLNTTKYPPSLLYALMTLGPALLFLRSIDGEVPAALRFTIVYGRVPMFYYIVHFALVHLTAAIVALALNGSAHWMFESPSLDRYPFTAPPGWGFPLPVVYLVWLCVVVSLYPACRWYASLRAKYGGVLRYI